jgi:Peptidase S24-like
MSSATSERLQSARKNAGYSSAIDAIHAFGWQESAYRHHENGTRGFGVDMAKRYARAYRVQAGWLLGIEEAQLVGSSVNKARVLTVKGSVAAGLWRESEEWPLDDQFEIAVGANPFPNAERFSLQVDGYSMDTLFEPGTLLDCISIFDLDLEPENEDVIIVRRVNSDGLRELTVKQYLRDENGKTWLVPKSTKPEFQAPIEIGMPDFGHVGDHSIEVTAYVIGAYQPLSSRLVARVAMRGRKP